MMGRYKALVVDDDSRLQTLLREYLEGFGFSIIPLLQGKEASNTVLRERPHIVVLDIMLPDTDGLEILKEIRRFSDVPVIMLTARGEDTDRIVGLELGADDYLPKPFNPRELLARMKAVMRRKSDESTERHGSGLEQLEFGSLVLNRARHTLERKGIEVELSFTEFRILEVLMENPDIVLTRDQLMSQAREREGSAFDRSIDMHVSRLRGKLMSIGETGARIKTVWGTGYMWVSSP
jgi:two-component system phosphate regulon response regulator OmpR